jgi:trk system potassium uptake protein
MKIIILGAGQVGGTLAATLASEAIDITVVDTNADRLAELQDRLDIATVHGVAAHPGVLAKAGAEDADILIAVTNSDEMNMVACQIAYTLYRTPTKIARIRSRAYVGKSKLFNDGNIPIDVIISPEQLVTRYITRLLQYPGALQVLDFADGRVQLVGVRAYYGGAMVGHELREIRKHMPKVETRIAAIFRRGEAIRPQGDTVVEAEDEVFFIAARKNILPVMSKMRRLDTSYRRVMIAGGGNIGERLARATEHRYNIKIIEMSYERCKVLSEELNRTVVLHGSATDHELLSSENIDDIDVFLALTNDDEDNIMASLLARRLGARKVITLITNPAYADLLQGGEIDIALSPQQVTVGSLLAHVRRGDVTRVHSLRRGAAEALEVIAHGDKRSSKVVGRRLDEINLPEGASIGAVVRGEEVLIAHGDVVVESEDHLILFLVDKGQIREVEKLFQVGFTFF